MKTFPICQILNKERKVLQLDTELANVTQSLAHKTKEVRSTVFYRTILCHMNYENDWPIIKLDTIIYRNRAMPSREVVRDFY